MSYPPNDWKLSMRCLRAISFAVLILAAQLCAARDLAVVVNPGNGASAVTSAQLEKMFKMEAGSWPDGKKVKIFLTDPGAPESRIVVQRVYKMAPAEIKALLDAHKTEIQIVSSDDLVVTMVENNAGAIGIVNVYSINSHVKVLKIDDKLPMESGYLLHGN